MADEAKTADQGRTDVTFDELEAQISADAEKNNEQPKLEEIKLGEGVPDEFKGKSVAELLQLSKGLSDSLRLSEQRRTELEQAQRNQPVAQSVVEAPKEEPELTREQLAELHQKDPLAAIEYMQARSDKRAAENLEKRIGGLASGAAGTAEANARAKYADEFELFGPQIKAALDSGLVKKEAMAQPQAWDDLISWIRGKPENIDKLFDYRVNKGKRKEAQEEQVATSGTTMRSTVRAPVQQSHAGGEMDDLKKEIARNLFPDLEPEKAYAEYRKWEKV